jgi:hypothetical protein
MVGCLQLPRLTKILQNYIICQANLNPCVIRLIKEIEWRHITKMKRITQEINNKLLTTTLYLKISCQLLKAIILTLITLF